MFRLIGFKFHQAADLGGGGNYSDLESKIENAEKDEDIDAALDQLKQNISKETAQADDESDEDKSSDVNQPDKSLENSDAKKTDDVKTNDAPGGDKNENPNGSDKTDKPKGNFIITEEYIKAKFPDNYKKLSSFIGKDIDELIKWNINQDKIISKRQEQKPQPVQQKVEKLPDPKTDADNARSYKEKMALNALKSQYPDFPTTQEEWNELSYSNYKKAQEYFLAERQVMSEIDSDYNQIVEFQNNFTAINDSRIKSQVSAIQEEVKGLGVELADLGIDLNPITEGDFEFNEYVDNKLLKDENGNWDPRIVSTQFGVPIVDESALVDKFFRLHKKDIALRIQANARKEAIEKTNANKPLPELSTSAAQGKVTKPVITGDFDNKTDEEIDKELAMIKKNITGVK